jgi:cell division protein FtsL
MATAYRFNEEFEEYARLVTPASAPASAPQAKHKNVPARPPLKEAARIAPPPTPRSNEAVRAPERILRIPRRTTLAAGGKRPAMVEFYTVKRIDNSRLVRHVEPVKLRNFYKALLLGGIVALFCMFYVYQHFRCIDLSFQLEDLKAKQVAAQSRNSELKLEIETLRDPARIDVIAQKELGLKRPDSAQVREYAGVDGAQVAAVQFRSAISRR